MAFPPPVLSTDNTDLTPSPGVHPGLHNDANKAINDIVARITSLINEVGLGDAALRQDLAAEAAARQAHETAADPHAGYLRMITANVGDGVASTFTVTHGFGTRRLTVQIFEMASPYQQVFPTVELPTVNDVRVIFSSPPALSAYEIVVSG